MDEEEIELWYEEQKQKIMEEFLAQIQNQKDHKEAQEIYSKKLKEVMKNYRELVEKAIANKKKKTIRKNILDKVKFKK